MSNSPRKLVVCIGDSITQGSYQSIDWPRRLNIMLGTQYMTTNHGVSGRTSEYLYGNLWGPRVRLGVCSSQSPPSKTLVMMMGTNDAGITGGGGYQTGYASVSTNAALSYSFQKNMADEAIADGMHVIVLRVTPRGAPSTTTATLQDTIDSVWNLWQSYIANSSGTATTGNFALFNTHNYLAAATGIHTSGLADGNPHLCYNETALSGATGLLDFWTTFDSHNDGLHPNDAAGIIIASSVCQIIQSKNW